MNETITAPPHNNVHTVRRGIIFTVLVIVLIIGILMLGAAQFLNNTPTPVQQYDNAAAQGATKSTGAPTKNTHGQSDRTVPSSSGSNANSMLNNRIQN